MSFTVGDLVAKLRGDNKQFVEAMTESAKSADAVTASVAKIDTTLKGATRSMSPYVRAVRESRIDIRAVSMEYDRMTQSTSEAHAEALKMNAALGTGQKGTAAVAQQAVLPLNRVNSTLRIMAQQALGVNPVLGNLSFLLGTFAVGSVMMTGVLAGLAAVGFAWRKLRQDAVESAAALKEAETSLEALARARRLEPIGGELGASTRLLIQERNRLGARQGELSRLGLDQPSFDRFGEQTAASKEFAENTARIEALTQLIALGEAEIAKAAADRAEQERRAAHQLQLQKQELEEMLRLANDLLSRSIPKFSPVIMQQTDALQRQNGILGGLTGPFGSLTGIHLTASQRFGSRIGMGSMVNSEISRRVADEDFKPLSEAIRESKDEFGGVGDTLRKFGAGAEGALKGFLDIGNLGANLAGSFLNNLIGGFTNGFEKASITFKDGFVITKQNTAAVRELVDSFDKVAVANRIFGDTLSLTRARLAAGDVNDPAGQFAALQQFLVGQVPTGGGLFGTGSMAMSIARLSPDTIGTFVQGIIDQMDAGTLTSEMLGGLNITDFLQVLLEMESLADAAGEAAGELSVLASTVRNAPSGYRYEFTRFMAQTPTQMENNNTPLVIIEEVIVHSKDPHLVLEEISEEARRQARLGGTTNLQLATRPSARRTASTV